MMRLRRPVRANFLTGQPVTCSIRRLTARVANTIM